MSYDIEFEDRGQDLKSIKVDETTGEILEAGEMSRIYATGSHFVLIDMLFMDRKVRFRSGDLDTVEYFDALMVSLSRDGDIIASAR